MGSKVVSTKLTEEEYGKLVGFDTLLYVNPQFPRGSVTGDGVDFSDSTNIGSLEFTVISALPKFGGLAGFRVYVFDADWTTTGVSIVSKQILASGPNAGMAELVVSSTHLGKFIVGGAVIPPEPHKSPTGTGLLGVGPGSGIGGGGGNPVTAKVHRIYYDVCDENISRILVSHDSSSPPKIQLLTTKTGIIDATLAVDQPFAEENQL